MRRQHPQGQFPDNAPLHIGEVMEFVHHHRGDILKRERLLVEQSVEQDFRDNDQNRGIRIDPPIAGDQTHVIGMKSPTSRG